MKTVNTPKMYSFLFQLNFVAVALQDTVILMDSFRYIAPTADKDSCVVYK